MPRHEDRNLGAGRLRRHHQGALLDGFATPHERFQWAARQTWLWVRRWPRRRWNAWMPRPWKASTRRRCRPATSAQGLLRSVALLALEPRHRGRPACGTRQVRWPRSGCSSMYRA
ncbi:hypothetical protein DSL92_07130 [Billgrantia gudaonensis]|uniref:Uncharacterized protein n=1 Tax=Billgrantia gudaonensis TaxID=376427 RepID=A0A432JH27_9GAMM|nr:hypothetical protein DSL92_07130 [Halomonas gudaonensis]